jgi:hypothetical protein
MSNLIWLPVMQMRRIEPYFPLSHGVPRVDDWRIISGITFVIKNGLRWRDAPAEYGPPKTRKIEQYHPQQENPQCFAPCGFPTFGPTGFEPAILLSPRPSCRVC